MASTADGPAPGESVVDWLDRTNAEMTEIMAKAARPETGDAVPGDSSDLAPEPETDATVADEPTPIDTLATDLIAMTVRYEELLEQLHAIAAATQTAVRRGIAEVKAAVTEMRAATADVAPAMRRFKAVAAARAVKAAQPPKEPAPPKPKCLRCKSTALKETRSSTGVLFGTTCGKCGYKNVWMSGGS